MISSKAFNSFAAKGPVNAHRVSRENPIEDKSGRFDKLQGTFKQQLTKLANDFFKTYREPLVLTDTVRTDAEQAQAHRNKPTLALPAGHPNAMHPKGLAVDVDTSQARLISSEMLARNGLHLPALYKGENWHIEPVNKPVGFAGSKPAKSSPEPRDTSPADLLCGLSRGTPRAKLEPQPLSLGKGPSVAEVDNSRDQRRLLQAAVEVEAVFLEKLLQQQRRALVEPLNPSQKQMQGYLSLADQQLARSLAAGGGIGLAQKILQDLASLESQPHTENRHAQLPAASGKNGPST
jgi:hypothetical protein